MASEVHDIYVAPHNTVLLYSDNDVNGSYHEVILYTTFLESIIMCK